MAHLLLCSASPRRRELLSRLGLSLELAPPHIDESQRPGEPPRTYVERLSREKVEAGRRLRPEGPTVAVAADTIVVARGDEVLGKPADDADALRMLQLLSGVEHRVYTAVSVLSDRLRSACVETRVRFARLSDAQLRWLVATGDGNDKAGAYGLQGAAGPFIERIDGSVTNVVGLPMTETIALLEQAGVALPW